MYKKRMDNIIQEMKSNKIPQIIISDPASIFYFTGKWFHPGNRMLVLFIDVNGVKKLFVNELFPINEELDADIVWFKDIDDPVKILSEYINVDVPIGIDKNWPARFLLELMKNIPQSSLTNGSILVDRMRMVKDSNEIELMKNASRINDMAMEAVINLLPSRHSEKKIAQMLIEIYESLGSQSISFSPIIAYGANCADPHHGPGNSIVEKGDSIIIDIGCRSSNYCSDMTRTFFYKSVSEKKKEIYHIVREANIKAISAVKPGVRFCDIDSAARNHIEEMGYGSFFTHRTGHSIGLEVHDFGDVSSVNTDIVKPGMIFSIEPGIYIPGEFGVRIEDLVLVTEDGCEVLNKFSKDLTIVG